MTPAVNAVKKSGIYYKIHEYAHDPAEKSYGMEAVRKLNVPAERVFKTLVVSSGDNRLAVGIVPVSSILDMKQMAGALGIRKASMAGVRDVERSTGYVLGGVSPIGQKKRLKTVIDSSALDYDTIFVSAGRRGVDIELNPEDLQMLTDGIFARLCP